MSQMMKDWWKSATIRAIKTAAQTALGILTASVAITEIDWPLIAASAFIAAIASYLTSIAGIPEVDCGASVPVIVEEDHKAAESEDANTSTDEATPDDHDSQDSESD